QFAVEFTGGRVLDFASGVGYGTHIIAKKCKKKVSEVIGIDIDSEAVRYAKSTYYHPLTKFMHEDATDSRLPEKIGRFDTVLSFETIEHVRDEKQRSEEHTSELQSRFDLVCRLLLEKKKKRIN